MIYIYKYINTHIKKTILEKMYFECINLNISSRGSLDLNKILINN